MASDILKMTAVDVALPSPPAGVELAGFLPVRRWDGSGDELKASLLRVDREDGSKLVIVAIDTLFLDHEFQARLQERLGSGIIPVLVASHTHFAPALARSVRSLGDVDDGYYEAILNCVARTIQSGAGRMPATIGHFTIPTDLTVNRRREGLIIDYSALRRGRLSLRKGVSLAANPDGIVDPNLRCISLRDDDGRPVACIWSLAAHAAFTDAYSALSADFPGRVRALLKERFGPDFVSLYLPGLAGSAIPNIASKPFSQMTGRERIFRILPFHHAIQPMAPASYEAWSRRVATLIAGPLPSLDYEPVTGMPAHHGVRCSDPVFWDSERQGLALDLNVIRLGTAMEIITCNGELLGEWKPLLDQLAGDGGMRMVSGYAAGACLYVPPTGEIRRGGYEVDRFRKAFGLKGNFVEGIDTHVISAFEQLLAEA